MSDRLYKRAVSFASLFALVALMLTHNPQPRAPRLWKCPPRQLLPTAASPLA